MKKQFELSMSSPCKENFKDFSATQKGGFCSSCSTEVVDFTTMTDQEIVDYFNTNEGKVCGRFHESQLKSYAVHQNTKITNYAALGIVGLSLASLLASSPAQAQQPKPPKTEQCVSQPKDGSWRLSFRKEGAIVEGTVNDKDGSLPGVIIWIKGTDIALETDFDGRFKFSKPLQPGTVLVISYLGYLTQEVKIDTCTPRPLKIVLQEGGDILDELVVMGEVQIEKLFKSKKSKFKKTKKKHD
jgi:hypothetical protein